MTDVTLEVLGFLMLDQDLLVIKFSVAIPDKNNSLFLTKNKPYYLPTPRLTLLLLLSAHSQMQRSVAYLA